MPVPSSANNDHCPYSQNSLTETDSPPLTPRSSPPPNLPPAIKPKTVGTIASVLMMGRNLSKEFDYAKENRSAFQPNLN